MTSFDDASPVDQKTTLEEENVGGRLSGENKKEPLKRRRHQKRSTASGADEGVSNDASRYDDNAAASSASRQMIQQADSEAHRAAAPNKRSTLPNLQPTVCDPAEGEDWPHPGAGSIDVTPPSSATLPPNRHAQLATIPNSDEEDRRKADALFESPPRLYSPIPWHSQILQRLSFVATDQSRTGSATVVNIYQNAAALVDTTRSSSPNTADVLQQSAAKSRKRSETNGRATDRLLQEVLSGFWWCFTWLGYLLDMYFLRRFISSLLVVLFLGFLFCQLPMVPYILPCGYYKLCNYASISTGSRCSSTANTRTVNSRIFRDFEDVFDKSSVTIKDSDQAVTLPYALGQSEIEIMTFGTTLECGDD